MEPYVGMNVSLKETSICVVDGSGGMVCEGTVISEPSAIAGFIKAKAGDARRIGLETGPSARGTDSQAEAGNPVVPDEKVGVTRAGQYFQGVAEVCAGRSRRRATVTLSDHGNAFRGPFPPKLMAGRQRL